MNKLAWDTSVWVAVLEGEDRSPEELQGLFEVIDLADRELASILTSDLIYTEVYDQSGSGEVPPKLEEVLKRPNYLIAPGSPEIQKTAGRIRSLAQAEGRKVKAADSIHLATAIAYKVDAFHTFDDKLLALDGSPVVSGLRIKKPRAEQTLLALE